MATSKQKPYIERFPDDLIMSILDRLPHDVIVRNILGRLESYDLARIRTVCKTLHSLSSQVTSISFFCSGNRYRNSLSGTITPFKTVVKTLISNLPDLESISIHVSKDVKYIYFDNDTEDDLHLTDVGFVKEWLPRCCDRLRVLKISDFFPQSHWKRSHVLGLISSNCNRLVELELRKACLSADGLNQLPTLTSLTLDLIRLDDEVLNKITTCFPRLKVFNLHRVKGLTHPKIHLLHLTSCQWTRPNCGFRAPLATPPLSLAIVAPSLIRLTLNCQNPRFLILETPSLSDLSFSVAQATRVQLEHNVTPQSVQLSSSNNPSDYVMMAFTSGPIQKVSFDLEFNPPKPFSNTKVSLESLFKTYPNLSSLTLGPGAWFRFHDWFFTEGWQSKPEMGKLREITLCVCGHGIVDDAPLIIASILERCTILSDMTILISQKLDWSTRTSLMLRIITAFPGVNWNWGLWRRRLRDCSFPMEWDVVWQRPWKESSESILLKKSLYTC